MRGRKVGPRFEQSGHEHRRTQRVPLSLSSIVSPDSVLHDYMPKLFDYFRPHMAAMWAHPRTQAGLSDSTRRKQIANATTIAGSVLATA